MTSTVLIRRKEIKTRCQHGYVQSAKLNTQADVVRQNVRNVEHRKKNM